MYSCFLQEHHIQLEHTEVGVVLTGAEEAGLRGAKAWVKAHKEEYWDIPTYLFTIDTIHHPQFLMVNQRDMNGLVRNDRELADLFVNAAKEMNIPCGKGSIPMMGGSTDSAAFRQGGFRSVSIAGMDQDAVEAWDVHDAGHLPAAQVLVPVNGGVFG